MTKTKTRTVNSHRLLLGRARGGVNEGAAPLTATDTRAPGRAVKMVAAAKVRESLMGGTRRVRRRETATTPRKNYSVLKATCWEVEVVVGKLVLNFPSGRPLCIRSKVGGCGG